MKDKELPKETYIIDDSSIAEPPYNIKKKSNVIPINRAKGKKNDKKR